jgi:hypothetical protein
MKITNYDKFLEKEDSNYREDEYSYMNDSLDDRKPNKGADEEMMQLVDIIQQTLDNANVDCEVDFRGYNIYISCFLRVTERLSEIVNVFEEVNKVKKDLLQEYESLFEMYELEGNEQCLEFYFSYN